MGDPSGNGTGIKMLEEEDGLLRPLCVAAGQTLRQTILFYHIQLVPLTITILSILALVFIFFRNRIAVHGNLLVLFSNIILASFLSSLVSFQSCIRNSFKYFAYKDDPCRLLTPLPLVALSTGPIYLFNFAYPALHFCITIERLRATLLAAKYEEEGQQLGILMVATIWICSFAYMGYVIAMAFMEPEMTAHPLASAVLTTPRSSLPIFLVNIVVLVAVILTAFFDWRITKLNKQMARAKTYQTYSLSRNYQLNENGMTMRLIFPLDTLYALLYALYQALMILIRAYRASLSTADYVFYLNLAVTVLYVYYMVTIAVYIRFVMYVSRCRRRTVNPMPTMELATIHFRQLKDQWK